MLFCQPLKRKHQFQKAIDAGIPDAKWRSFEATVAKHFWAGVALVVVRDVSPNLSRWWFQTLNVLHTFAGITFLISFYIAFLHANTHHECLQSACIIMYIFT